ncbi:hypothetical protein [Winogradskyella sp.]|uniref:hypothetical protein n=2 Tax=Winogradskyella sp. TaxID=1883156 RepID=UPI003519792F
MRTAIIILTVFLSQVPMKTYACDCESQGNFYKVSPNSDLVALVKINKYLTFKDIYDSPTPMSMEVEILEVFKGVENRETVIVWGDVGHLCRPYLNQFSVDSLYVIAFQKGEKGSEFGHLNETENDYSISNCGEYWLKINSESNTIINKLRSFYDRTNDLTPNDFKEIFQKALDFPELQQYYHTEFDSTRKQVIIKYFGEANHNNLIGVTKFDRQVIIRTEEEIKQDGIKHYFGLGDWVCGTNSVRMQLYYPIEGITLSLMFKKINNEWTITSNSLWEE